MRKKVILYVHEQEHLVSTSAQVFITCLHTVLKIVLHVE